MLADIRGVTINYEVSGNENGPWLTFSNSLATNLRMWDEQEAALAGDFRILRYDKRGHGKSAPVEGPYSFDDLIDDIVGLWDRLGIRQSYVVGLSIGGMTAQGLTLRHADRVAATVMANTTAFCSDDFRAAFDQARGGGQRTAAWKRSSGRPSSAGSARTTGRAAPNGSKTCGP